MAGERHNAVTIQRVQNTLKTTVLLAGLGGLLVLAGGAIAGGTGALIGLVIGLVIVGSSYWFSDKLAIRAARASPSPTKSYYYVRVRWSRRCSSPTW